MEEINNNIKFGCGNIPTWKNGEAHDITFVVTEDCNLRCKYCYISGKASEKVMTIETAKKAVDYLLDSGEVFNSEAVVWNFIGGEPLLEIDLIDQICDYIKVETYRRNHKWGNCYRFNICTNGILYDTEKVQNLIKKNKSNISMGITIDGTKEKHDLQRVYPDGKGSYDDIIDNVNKWKEQFGSPITKVTIGHDDLIYVAESIIHLWNLGLTNVPANVVYEDVWEAGDDVLFEQQLMKLADYVLDNELWNKYSCTLFEEHIGYPQSKKDKCRNHCGTGKMLAIDYRGMLYPCIRFMDYSLSRKKEFSIGSIYDGIDLDKVRTFYGLDAVVQSTDECLNCEVAAGCGWCQGNNYDNSDSDTLFQRSTYICKMHKARVRAVNYYWEKLKEKTGKERQWVSKNNHLYFILSDDSVEHCNYSNNDNENFMNHDVLNRGLDFAAKNFYRPVLLHSNSKSIIDYNKVTKYKDKIDIYPVERDFEFGETTSYPVYSAQNIHLKSDKSICIVNIHENEIKDLDSTVIKLLEKFQRININIKINSKDFNFSLYKEKLKNISEEMLKYYKNGVMKEVNKITDILLIDEMENCNFGVNNYALAPNGKIYICPAFYYNDPENYICSIGEEISIKNQNLFKISSSKFCSQCEIYSCNRCVYDNKKRTREYSVPSSIQCKVSSIEYSTSYKFIKEIEDNKIEIAQFKRLKEIEYDDIIEKIKSDTFSPYNMC
ncbi:radical SAM peptide maturase, CXXX-repeat target family [Clostridium gasigenes]|uniref:radical SAM peptide maturase, CXXX-repeat target family n=1 Tax=Clostridium gasigenes TaxID=94869 RepID=UPI0015871D5E|nr:radical SAM peptide maturase, CXXX-repeat target family [Clostridium gasigenes]